MATQQEEAQAQCGLQWPSGLVVAMLGAEISWDPKQKSVIRRLIVLASGVLASQPTTIFVYLIILD